MKTLTRIFYDILLKLEKANLKDFKADAKVLKTYFEPLDVNKSVLIGSLGIYVNDFYNFCFELKMDNMLKGKINFKYSK